MNVNTLSGFLITTPVLRYTSDATPVTSFILAVEREYSRTKKTFDFITVVAWKKMAIYCVSELSMATLVEVKGSTRTGRRKLKNIRVYQEEHELENFTIPVFEVYAQNIKELGKLDSTEYQKYVPLFPMVNKKAVE